MQSVLKSKMLNSVVKQATTCYYRYKRVINIQEIIGLYSKFKFGILLAFVPCPSFQAMEKVD